MGGIVVVRLLQGVRALSSSFPALHTPRPAPLHGMAVDLRSLSLSLSLSAFGVKG
jgi:hypothetical protein